MRRTVGMVRMNPWVGEREEEKTVIRGEPVIRGEQLNKDEHDAANGWGDRTNLQSTVKPEGSTPKPNTTPDTSFIMSDAAKIAANNKNKAQGMVAGYGKFQYGNQDQLDAIMNSILNREEFTFDLDGDALYNQYKDKAVQQGKMAMMDTMGQAAAMTGGYGNSFAQSVGQQAYQGQLQNLNDIIPELYQMALDRYNAEGQQLYDQYGMLVDDYNRQYGEYNDEYNKRLAERDYATNEYYNQYAKDWSEHTYKTEEQNAAYKAALGKLGYTDEDIASGNIEPEDTVDEDTAMHLDRMNSFGSYEAATDYVNKLPNLTDEEKIDLLSQYEAAPGLTDRTWVVDEENGKGYGGGNLLGINRNAQIKDAYGNSMTLADFREQLMREENMTLAEANAYIKEMQDKLGIKSGLQGFFDNIGFAFNQMKKFK